MPFKHHSNAVQMLTAKNTASAAPASGAAFCAVYKNGLYFFSCPIFVCPMCPGSTWVSSGRQNIFA